MDGAWTRLWGRLASRWRGPLLAAGRRWPRGCLLLTLTLAAAGYALLLVAPLVAGWLSYVAITAIPEARGWTGWGLLAAEAALAAGALWLTRQMWRERVAPVPGIEITRGQAPQLFALIGRLQAHFGPAPLDRVLLTAGHELTLVHSPRRALPFGLQRTLKIGLPLLLTCSPRHVEVLLARPLGAMNGARGRPGAWVDIANDLFAAYRRHYAGRWSPQAVMLRPALSLFSPLFDWLSLPARRRQALAADGYAMEIISDLEVREALVQEAVTRRYLETDFWPRFLALATRSPRPPRPVFAALRRANGAGLDKAQVRRWMEEAWGEAEDAPDETPGLRRRLEAIGHDRAEPPTAFSENAATVLLGADLAPLERRVEEAWLKCHLPAWKARHRRTQAERRRLQALMDKAGGGQLAGDEAWEYTLLAQRHLAGPQILLHYERLLAAAAQDARVQFYIGRFLLGLKDPRGVEALERAMALDHRHTVSACRLITRYMMDTGAKQVAQEYRRRALEYQTHAA